MPNGGIPKHMVLYPRDEHFVIHCSGDILRIIEKSAWSENKANATATCTLTAEEGAALAWHLRYWLGESALKPGYQMRGQVTAEYDF